MSCYFLIDTYIDPGQGRGEYDAYIALVKPIVETYGGEYILRSENVTSLSQQRNPQRVIIIRFPSEKELYACFGSKEYKAIQQKRTGSVDARGVIAKG